MRIHTLIVGGGAAGCVLAARLSEDPGREVVLLESGADGAPTPDLADARRNALHPRHGWGLRHRPMPTRGPLPLPRGRRVGGSSAINTCVAIRGHPADFDEWATLGLRGWSWEHCLPWFRRLERDLDHPDAPYHGAEGPLPLRRDPPQAWVPFQRAFVEACRAVGFPSCDDANAPDTWGVGPHTFNRTASMRRVSAADAWLTPEVRARRNLRILANAHVARVRWQGRRAVGADVRIAGRLTALDAAQVVLAAGAIHTPAILLRSGVGPRAELKRLGVPVLHDLPVGARLLDHPGFAVFLAPRIGVAHPHDPLLQTVLRVRSERSTGTADLQLQPGSSSGLRLPFTPFVTLMGHVGKPRGAGTWWLPSADPLAKPVLRSAYFDDPSDRRVAVEGLQLAAELATGPILAKLARPLWPSASTLGRRHALDVHVRRATDSGYHPCGTVPMGPDDAPWACTDADGRVRGVERLWVIDASLMPTIPTANIHLPTLMIAEKLSDRLRAAGS
jgi:choline dehydrogenase